MNIRQILPVLALVAAPLPAFAAAPIEGTWMLGESDNASKIRIAPYGAAKWCGTVIWSKQQDASKTPLVDAKNSNPALRTRKIVGLTVLAVLSNLWGRPQKLLPDPGKLLIETARVPQFSERTQIKR